MSSFEESVLASVEESKARAEANIRFYHADRILGINHLRRDAFKLYLASYLLKSDSKFPNQISDASFWEKKVGKHLKQLPLISSALNRFSNDALILNTASSQNLVEGNAVVDEIYQRTRQRMVSALVQQPGYFFEANRTGKSMTDVVAELESLPQEKALLDAKIRGEMQMFGDPRLLKDAASSTVSAIWSEGRVMPELVKHYFLIRSAPVPEDAEAIAVDWESRLDLYI
jgi:hypothetical protein